MSDSDSTAVVVVLTTLPDAEAAESLASSLLAENFIACANILPGGTSMYRWEGEVRKEREALMVLKTSADMSDGVVRRVEALHPYDVPEVLVLPVTGGAIAYLRWVVDEVTA